MALRQKLKLPGFEWHLQKELKPAKALRAPREVEFRRGANPSDVVADLLPYNSVKLCAPVGSGKSVRIPIALAMRTRALVFHVVPNRQLASHLFGYLVKLSQQEATEIKAPIDCYCGDVDNIPRNGLLFISAVDMVDVAMRHDGLGKFRGCSVFLDEAHESDAYTHVVRSLALQMGAERLIQASATFNPEVTGMRNTPGSVKMHAVDLGPPDTWEVDKAGSPFQVGTMRDGVLVFVDSRSAANKLALAYERMGLDVFRLTSSSTDAEVAEALRITTDKRAGLFAILADYTYRSGFTFQVSRVIDTGEVAYYDSAPGEFRRLNRRMFMFEREQAAGRVGRVAGNADYFYQKGACPAVMCDLEGVEKEAAAYAYRCLGYRPDGILSGAFMIDHDLPSGISVRAAMNGPYPLTYYVKHTDEAKNIPVNEYVERHGPVMQEDPPSYGAAVAPQGEEKEKQQFVGSSEKSSDWRQLVEDFAAQNGNLQLRDGTYYISQVRDSGGRGVGASLTFPGGLRSIREFSLRTGFQFAVKSLSREDRMYAMSTLLDRYNTVNAQIRGAKKAVQELIDTRTSSVHQDKILDVMEDLGADHADALACLNAAQVFMMSNSWVQPYDGELKVELAAKDKYYKQFSDKLQMRGHEDLEADIGHGVNRRIDKVIDRDRKKGRHFESYEGRKPEMLLPSWVGKDKRIEYDKDSSFKSKARRMFHRDYGHDDDDYVLTRRTIRITERVVD